MKAISVAAVLVAALAFTRPASAKEPLRATICGESGCTTITDSKPLNAIPSGENTVALGPAAPYYRLEVVSTGPGGGEHSFVTYYVPSANAMAWPEQGVVRLHPIYGKQAIDAMRALVAGIRPFRLPRVSSVRVGDRRVTRPAAQSYLRLFAQSSDAAAAESPDDWADIDLHSLPGAGSPWTDGRPDLRYSASSKLLDRDGRRSKLSDELVASLEGGRALDPPSGGGPARRWALGLALVAAIVLGSLLRVARRVYPSADADPSSRGRGRDRLLDACRGREVRVRALSEVVVDDERDRCSKLKGDDDITRTDTSQL
jgi:hypothetical protein